MCLVILVGILHLLYLIKGTEELKYFKVWQGVLLTRICFTLAKNGIPAARVNLFFSMRFIGNKLFFGLMTDIEFSQIGQFKRVIARSITS